MVVELYGVEAGRVTSQSWWGGSTRELARFAHRHVTVSVRATPGVAQRPITTNGTHTSTRDNSTTMSPIDDALAAIEALELGETLVYQKVADQFGVDRSTLARRHKGVQAHRETKDSNQQKFTQQQEEELVKYIEELTARHIPPTRDMIANFASAVAQKPVSESWVTRFINKYSVYLIS